MSLAHRYRRIAYQALPTSVATDLRKVRLGEPAEDSIKLKAIDNDVKNILLEEGYSEDAIDDMSPEDAKSIIDTLLQKTPSVPADIKKEIKSIDKLVDEENDEVSSELSSLAAEKEEVSEEISDLYKQIDKLGDITEEEENALSSKEKKERDNLHAALSAGAQELARLKSSIVSRMKALNGAKTMLSPADDSLTVALLPPGEDEEESDIDFDEELYSDLTPKLRDVLSDKAEMLHSLSKWRRQLNSVSEKINRVQAKRDSIRRRLLKSIKSPIPTKATRLLRSELRKQDDAMSSLLDAQSTLLLMLTRLERDFRDLKVQEKVIADDWEERSPKLLYTPEEKEEQAAQNERERRQRGVKLVQRIKNNKEDIPSAAVAFFEHVTKDYYEPFIRDSISHNVPSVPKIDKTIEKIVNSAFRYIEAMNKLSDNFKNNPAHLSAIRLVPGLYSMLMRSLLVGIGKENPVIASYAEAASVCVELEQAGLMKEAASLRDSLGFLQGKAKSALEVVQNTVHKVNDFIDKVQFAKSDTGPRRDPKAKSQESMKFYRQLKAVTSQVRSRIEEAEALVAAYQEAGDEHNKKVAIYALTQLKEQLLQLEEQAHDLQSGKGDASTKGV